MARTPSKRPRDDQKRQSTRQSTRQRKAVVPFNPTAHHEQPVAATVAATVEPTKGTTIASHMMTYVCITDGARFNVVANACVRTSN
jgi:hypothetical protein